VVSGFCHGVSEIFSLFGYYSAFDWQLITDVSVKPISFFFFFFFLGFLCVKDGFYRLS
jgi:hypothetical protein